MSILIDLTRAEDPRDVVHRAVQALAEGKIVAFPTETVYGLAASALNEKAVAKLLAVKGRPAQQPFTLAIRGADEALDYVPGIPPVGLRLARRCWPGPVTLVLNDDHPESVTKRLPSSVQNAVVPNGTLGLRVPAHSLILDVLHLIAGPLVLTSANRSGQPDAITAQQIVESLGADVDLILDDGRSKFGQPSSVVHVTEGGVQILRRGVITDSALKRLASFIMLFVCTGNTCRSPMAELLMRKRVAERLQCPIGKLEDYGVMITSAGISAMAGGRATPEAMTVMKDRSLDLSQHESQPISDRLLRFADLVLTMTRGHRDAILAQWPEASPRIHVLSKNHGDIADPIGGPQEQYRRCAEQIDTELQRWMEELNFKRLLPGEITERR